MREVEHTASNKSGDSVSLDPSLLVRDNQHVNPFTPKGSPFDEQNSLALDRVKSIKSLLGVKGLRHHSFECMKIIVR